MNLIEQQRNHFNNIAQEYYDALTNEKAELLRILIYKELFRGTELAKLLRSKRTIAVLEPMCGYGIGRFILKSLFPHSSLDYEGFDYSEEIVKLAKKQYPELNFYHQDVTTFQSNKKYDLIILLSGLHHVPTQANKVVKNMARHLNRGGFLINVEPTYNNILTNIISRLIYKNSGYYDYETERRFSLAELNSIYYNAGLSIEKQIYPGMLLYLLYWFNPYPVIQKLGNRNTVKRMFKIEHSAYHNWIGKKLSCATFSILKSEGTIR